MVPSRLSSSSSSFVGVALALAACGSDEGPQTLACTEDVVLIAAVGQHNAASELCSAPGGCIGGAELGVAPVLTSSNESLFFVGRDEDLVLGLDPACGTPLTKLDLDSLAPRDELGTKTNYANPHDVAVAPDGTLFIPLYNVPLLAFAKDGVIEKPLDLSQYDELDGNPQAESVSIVTVGGIPKAFVALERLDDGGYRMPSTRPSQMLRIDVATREVEAVIQLEGRNPFNPMGVLDGALFLAEPGSFDSNADDYAGIERFDTATSTTRLLIKERDLGASIVQLAVTKGCGAAIVAGPQRDVNPTSVITFDPETGQIFSSVAAPLIGPTGGYDLYGITWRGDRLYVGDRRRDGNAGFPVHVFDRSQGCTLTSASSDLYLEQAPISLRPAQRPL